MITFTRGSGANSNTIEIDFGNESHFVSPDAPVKGKSGEQTVYVGHFLNLGNSSNYFKIKTTDINGRPSDDGQQVAEWLRDTYFYGISGGAGGGDFPADYANSGNQATMITELQDIETAVIDVELSVDELKAKVPSAQVTEEYDHRTYDWNVDDSINYISYLTGGVSGTEVARLTFSYDGNGNVTQITKT